MEINLLPQNETGPVGLDKYKPRVYFISTTILILYVVVGAAISGWWFFLNNKEVEGTGQIAFLTGQIEKLASVESIVRQTENRANFVSKSLVDRQAANETLHVLQTGPKITAWSYIENGLQTVTISDIKLSEIEAYTALLKSQFPAIKIATTTRKFIDNWEGVISLK